MSQFSAGSKPISSGQATKCLVTHNCFVYYVIRASSFARVYKLIRHLTNYFHQKTDVTQAMRNKFQLVKYGGVTWHVRTLQKVEYQFWMTFAYIRSVVPKFSCFLFPKRYVQKIMKDLMHRIVKMFELVFCMWAQIAPGISNDFGTCIRLSW